MSADGQGSFAGSGAVGRYWQTRCRGFAVRSARGRRLGTVEAVELDRETHDVVLLLVHRRRRKPLRVRPDCVELVDPWQQSLVLAQPRRRSIDTTRVTRRVARGGRVTLAGASAVGRGAQAAGGRTTALAHGAWRAVPKVGRRLAWAGPRLLFAFGLAAWVYALLVFTVVRAVVWLLAALTAGTARGGARLRPHLHGVK